MNPFIYGASTNPFVVSYGQVVQIVVNNNDTGEYCYLRPYMLVIFTSFISLFHFFIILTLFNILQIPRNSKEIHIVDQLNT
jgi:hypothetical protein